jgi:diguanylate cyclase (GGDEF)-like protein
MLAPPARVKRVDAPASRGWGNERAGKGALTGIAHGVGSEGPDCMTNTAEATDTAPAVERDSMPDRPAGGAVGEPMDEEAASAATLRLALLESRQRWRQFGALAADLLFETDSEGRLTFAAPDCVLGWPAAALLGQPGHVLLQHPSGPDPFRFTIAVHRRHTWLRTMDGSAVCMAVTTVPLLDSAGQRRGVRGVAVNVTAQERTDAATASALRRGEVLDRILSQMREEVLAPRMMRAVLEGVMRALGGEGAAVLDLAPVTLSAVQYCIGEDPAPLLPDIMPALIDGGAPTQTLLTQGGVQVLACQASTRFGDTAALVVWRAPGVRLWDSDDLVLARSVTGVVRIVMEHEAIQRELARQARTDPLTGLLNRRAFLEEAGRRLDRLVGEGLPGTVIFIDLDGLKQLNDCSGHEAGDAALILTSGLLRRTFRPSDLVARLGGDEFAVWLDGADALTAAERAESLRQATPGEFGHLRLGCTACLGMSIGIATRDPVADETLDQVIQRADQAMYEVKRNGRGHWRVSNLTRVR